MEEHAQRNRKSFSIGWSIHGGSVAGIVLLVILVTFALTDQGRFFLTQLSDSLFGGTESVTDLEPGQVDGEDAGIASLNSVPSASGETELNGGKALVADKDVRLIRDRLVALVHRDPNEEIASEVKAEARALVRQLPVSDNRKRRLNRVIDEVAMVPERSPTSADGRLMRLSGEASINRVSDTLMVVKGPLSINRINDTLVIVDGSAVINSSANNIIISSGDVQINAEGNMGGSLVMAEGMVRINSAAHTIIFADDGVRINAQTDVTNFGPNFFDDLKEMVEAFFL